MLTLGGRPIPSPAWKFMRSEYRTSPQDVLVDLRMHSPPTCIIRVCEELNIELRSAPKSTWYTAIKSTDDRAIIWVDTAEPVEKQRMGIAACLGNLLGYPIGTEYRSSGNTKNHKDKVLYEFASEILIPAHLLLARSAYFDRSISKLSSLFVVPEGTMRSRLIELHVPAEWHTP